MKGNKINRRRVGAVLVLFLMLVTNMWGNSTLIHAVSSAQANEIAEAFINTYWDAEIKYFYANSDRKINPQHKPGPQNGLYTDYWWEAQLWETIMDIYENTGELKYYGMIQDVYDGFRTAYPNWSENPFNDDIGWWSLACLRAYQLTGEEEYKNTAKSMFDFVYDNQFSSDYGGGIWWNRINFLPQKNVATNGTAVSIALQLGKILGDSTYLEKGQQLYWWLKNTFYNDFSGKVSDHISGSGTGTVSEWEYTYNFGVFAKASYDMYELTQNTVYRDYAFKAIAWVMEKMTNDGILIYEGEDDCPAFKMIFARVVKRIGNAEGRADYKRFIHRNANQAYFHKRADGLIGPDYSTVSDESPIQSIAAAAGVSICHLLPPDGNDMPIISGETFEAENARRYGINNENIQLGFSGRGYTAGWNSSGTRIAFEINAENTGTYQVLFRYAGVGDATRTLKINGNVLKNNLLFAATGAWSKWNYLWLEIPLMAGRNSIELEYQAQNTNWLNIDFMRVIPEGKKIILEAEAGDLHNVGTESNFIGFSGNGYVAGWNKDGQHVNLTVNVPAAGQYTLVLRYAVGNGKAFRQLCINDDTVETRLMFDGRKNWSDYRTITIENVHLRGGTNTISLVYSKKYKSANWLNYDALTIF